MHLLAGPLLSKSVRSQGQVAHREDRTESPDLTLRLWELPEQRARGLKESICRSLWHKFLAPCGRSFSLYSRTQFPSFLKEATGCPPGLSIYLHMSGHLAPTPNLLFFDVLHSYRDFPL